MAMSKQHGYDLIERIGNLLVAELLVAAQLEHGAALGRQLVESRRHRIFRFLVVEVRQGIVGVGRMSMNF